MHIFDRDPEEVEHNGMADCAGLGLEGGFWGKEEGINDDIRFAWYTQREDPERFNQQTATLKTIVSL